MSRHARKSHPTSFEEEKAAKLDKIREKKVVSTGKRVSLPPEASSDGNAMSPIMTSRVRRYVARCLPPFCRPKQLDGHTITQRGSAHRLDSTPNQDTSFIFLPVNKVRHYALVGVLDGHGAKGDTVARLVSEYLERELVMSLPPDLKTSRHHECDQNRPQVSVPEILEAAFKEAVVGVSNSACGADSGSTATIVVVHSGQVTVAWTGDSRAVITNGRGAIRLTTEMHRSTNRSEAKRVLEAGGRIKGGYVVDKGGKLGVSVTRAIGDMDLTHIGIISEPEIRTLPFESVQGGAVIIASDGLWDSSGISPDIVANTVAQRHQKGRSARRACEDLLGLACGRREAPNDDCTIACLLFP